jgi:hypothetical protein
MTIGVLYLEDSDGRPHTKEWVQSFTRTVRQCWATLLELGLAPPTWATRNSVVFDWLRRSVYSEFPDLMLCEHDWKLEFYCTKHYSDWRSKSIGDADTVEANNNRKAGSSKTVDLTSTKAGKQRAITGKSGAKRERSPSMCLMDDEDIERLVKRRNNLVPVVSFQSITKSHADNHQQSPPDTELGRTPGMM